MIASLNSTRPGIAIVFAAIAVLFGVATLFSGGAVLFVDGAGRASAGDYVPWVVWFNFLAGFAYIFAGIGFYLWQSWAGPLSLAIAGLTLLAFVIFGAHIFFGGSYELRTVGAMVLRSAVWLGIAIWAYRNPIAF